MTEEKFKLPKEFTEKWLEALRSGKYNQATGVLYSPFKHGYCCLGLAASLCGMKDEELYGHQFIQGSCYSIEEIEKIRKDGYPEELSTMEFYLPVSSLGGGLAEMNDAGITFEEIADWIEENVELV